MPNAIITDCTAFAYPPTQSTPPAKGEQFAEGIIRIRRIPDEWSEADYRYWYLPETDEHGKVLRPARISEHEKAAMQIAEAHNAIMQAGRTAVLSYIGSPSGSTTGWSQYLAIGTGAITATTPQDTALSNEVFRKAPVSFAVNGTLVDINIQLGTTESQVSMTNVGLYGNGASSTLGSGTLFTHALFSFTKGAQAISIDYLVNLL